MYLIFSNPDHVDTKCVSPFRIYVDIVINHMTGPSDIAGGTGGSIAYPNNLDFPAVPFGPNDFNYPCEITNYNDPIMVRNCQLVGLKDLNQVHE